MHRDKYINSLTENQNPSKIASSDIDELDPLTKLSTIRVENKRGLSMIDLNRNSVRSKIRELKFLISNNVDYNGYI